MKREYRVRVAVVFLFFISTAFIVGVGSLFPAYIYSALEERLHLNQVAAFKKTVDASAITVIQNKLSNSSVLLGAVSDTLQQNIFSTMINSVVALKGNVMINSLGLEQPTPDVMTIDIVGVAPTRSDLLSFKGRLQGLSSKETVDLPISTLAKDKDVVFSIQVNEKL